MANFGYASEHRFKEINNNNNNNYSSSSNSNSNDDGYGGMREKLFV
jgi:hypothetical protein